MGYFVSVVVGSDLIQVWVPQSYDICLLKNINKCATILTLCLSFSFSTVLKFYILAKRSIPAGYELPRDGERAEDTAGSKLKMGHYLDNLNEIDLNT